jgi:hypothetical protein
MACAQVIPSSPVAPAHQNRLLTVANLCQSRTVVMSGNLSTLRTHARHKSRFEHLAPAIQDQAERLLARYLLRHPNPTRWQLAALVAAASRVAQHGPPPNKQARLAYRRWKKWRVREQMTAKYGDPAASNSLGSRSRKP